MGVRTNVYFMTKLVDAAAKSRRWVTAVQLLQLMRSYGVLPNAVTYTCILAQMSKAKQVRHKRLHDCCDASAACGSESHTDTAPTGVDHFGYRVQPYMIRVQEGIIL